MSEGRELWRKFEDAFLGEVRSLSKNDLHIFWWSSSGRTKTNADRVLPGVGGRLHLEFVTEYLRIDGHYRDQKGCAQIFLEWENDVNTTAEEIDKLCYVRAPLKVLVTVSEWPCVKVKETWLNMIRDSWRWLPEAGETLYGFVIGEAKEMESGGEGLFFHFFTSSAKGDPSEEEEQFIATFDSGS